MLRHIASAKKVCSFFGFYFHSFFPTTTNHQRRNQSKEKCERSQDAESGRSQRFRTANFSPFASGAPVPSSSLIGRHNTPPPTKLFVSGDYWTRDEQ
jgi:hypothetical protein